MRRRKKADKNLSRLSDHDLDLLDALLFEIGGEKAMTVEELDGFFAALICGPELVIPSEYLPVIVGGELEIKSMELFQVFLGLLMEHWSAIASVLHSGKFLLPLLFEDEEHCPSGNDWALGFLRGMDMRREAWGELLNDEKQAGVFIPIFALAHEHDPDPEMRPYKEPITDEQRELLLAGLSAGVKLIYDYFKPHRMRYVVPGEESSTPRRAGPKIGRNDPCFCGSGKKYKRCCGTLPVNWSRASTKSP